MGKATTRLVDCCDEDDVDTSDDDDPSVQSSSNVSTATAGRSSRPSIDSPQMQPCPPLLAPLDRALSHKLMIRSPRFALRAISIKGRQPPLGACTVRYEANSVQLMTIVHLCSLARS
ncbi:hypothetical protein Q1695_002359 [Nippostrongylus brasiliensis]|nr:hypothetical protein Q1695_002359 [Nippostrongylus brasiliensis]